MLFNLKYKLIRIYGLTNMHACRSNYTRATIARRRRSRRSYIFPDIFALRFDTQLHISVKASEYNEAY